MQVEEAHIKCCYRIRRQVPHRSGIYELQVLDDYAGLDDVAFVIH